MKINAKPQEYIFTGSLYLPNRGALEINGEFTFDGSCDLEGKMNCEEDLRDTIQGNLVNAQRFHVPGSKENPRNFLMFAHFSQDLTNYHYFLSKKGNDFEGEYFGKANLKENKVKGIDYKLYFGNIVYADMILQDPDLDVVELILSKR